MKSQKRLWNWIFHPVTMIIGVNITWTVALLFWIFFFLKRYRQVAALAESTGQKATDLVSWGPLVLGILLLVFMFAGTIVLTLQLTRQAYDNKRIRRFLSAVSHELRTPITSVRLFLETMRDHDVTREQERQFVHSMLEDVDRLSAQVSGILDATRLEHGRMQFRAESLNLGSFVADFLRDRQHALVSPPSTHKIGFSADEDCLVVADRAALRTVLENLIRNSERYASDGTSIHVLVRRKGKWVVIDVADEGIGIERRDLKNVFRLFYRTDAGRRVSARGSGLGLYIVKGIAALHKGKVTVKSGGIGQGACFSFWLPGDPKAKRSET